MIDLDAMKSLCDAASPGPWMNGRMRYVNKDDASEYSYFVSAVDVTSGGDEYPMSSVALMTEPHEPNAEFIAVARTALPALIAELRAAREVVRVAKIGALDIANSWLDSTLSAYDAATKGGG